MADRVRIQIQFKKFIWTCPFCSKEDIVDAKMEGGNEYEHTCSECGKKFNQSGSNLKEYNGSVSYTESEYDSVTDTNIADAKKKLCDDWLYAVKNPPPYVEPTVEDIQNMYLQKLAEADVFLTTLSEKATVEELQELSIKEAEVVTKSVDDVIMLKADQIALEQEALEIPKEENLDISEKN